MFKKMLFVSLLIVTGCVSINKSQQSNYEGAVLMNSGDYNSAIKKYHEALLEAQSQGSKQYIAISMYGLGRSYAFVCQYDEAEMWLKKSITMRKNLLDSEIAYTSQNTLELARLYKTMGKYAAANVEFEKAIKMLIPMQIENTDPIGYAITLEDYVFTLRESGLHEKAKNVQVEIDGLRAKNPDRVSNYLPTPFPSKC